MAEGNYYLVDYNEFDSPPRKKFEMIKRMISCSGELREHFLKCGNKPECYFCQKFKFWVEVFTKYEKDTNQELDIGKIVDNKFVEEIFFGDDVMRVVSVLK